MDEQEFTQRFLTPNETMLRRQAFKLCRNRENAEDLFQNTAVKAWRFADAFRNQCKESTWMYRILYREFCMSLRDQDDRNANMRDDFEVVERTKSVPPSQVRVMERLEASAILNAEVGKLSARQRDVVDLRYNHDLELSEIATTLDLSLSAVKSRLFHAHQILSESCVVQKVAGPERPAPERQFRSRRKIVAPS